VGHKPKQQVYALFPLVNALFPEKMLIWTRTTANFMCKQRVLLPPRK